jgi:hypothetical protein
MEQSRISKAEIRGLFLSKLHMTVSFLSPILYVVRSSPQYYCIVSVNTKDKKESVA